MRRRHYAWALLGMIISNIFFFGDSGQAATPVEAFARLPAFGDASISPDGKYVALKTNIEGNYYFQIFDISGNNMNRTYASKTDDLDVRWIEWASTTRVLVSLGKARRRGGLPVMETRLIAVNYDGSKLRDMIKQKRGEIQVQIQDNVVSFLPDDPENVVMSYNDDDPSRPRAMLVNINSGKGKVLQSGKDDVYDWIADRQGRARIAWKRKDDVWTYLIRNHDDKEWRTLSTGRYGTNKDFDVWGFDKDPDFLYVTSNHEGGTSALYKYNVRTNQYVSKLFKHPSVDVSNILWNERTWQPRRISYVVDGVQYEWKDPVALSKYKMIEKSLPGYGISIVDISADDGIWLVYASDTDKPGGYYVFNDRLRKLSYLGSNYPELEGVKLSDTIPFDYQARDGLNIPAYLSLPPAYTDVAAAKNLPLVVMPHGGPTARDLLAFDPWLQMLTNRGYAVLQMNFRGSWGYGANFMAAGYGEWGGKMQDDVTDGVNFLVGEGIADRNRICIFGGSYGGYAALMGAVKTPNLYKCAIGLNGVYNLRDLISSQFRYIGDGSSDYWQSVIGKYSDKAFMESISPEKRAGEIQIPVLLAAADNDRVVRASQSKDMANALKRNRKNVQYLELESGGHGLTTSESRIPFFQEMDKFLAKHLK